MNTTANFSQSELVELIWTGRNAKTFSLKKKDLSAMDVEQLLAIAEENSIELAETAPATATPDLQAVGVRAVITDSGASVNVMDLKLIETNGFTTYFEFQDKKVMISGDIHLADAIQSGALNVGDSVPFHYHGVDTWKALSNTGKLLIPNNTGDRANAHNLSGTICKSACEPIAVMLFEEKQKRASLSLGMMKIAKDTGLKLRQVRQLDRADRVETAKDLLKALRGQ
jgi:hypothetical protein